MADAEEINELRRKLSESETRERALEAHYGKYDQEQHSRLVGYKTDCESLLERFKRNKGCVGAVASELAPIEDWCKSYTNATCGMEMNKHAPIATALMFAENEIKMVTAEASAGAEAREALSEKSKRLEEMEEKNKALELKLQGRDELLAKNRQTIDALIATGKKHGIISAQASMDFSKVASREKEMEEVANAVAESADVTNLELETPAAALSVVPVSASRAAGKRPMQASPMDPLLAALMAHSPSGSAGRVMPSGTGNSWVGSAGLASPGADGALSADLAAAIRMS
jgi:hypothetical protein